MIGEMETGLGGFNEKPGDNLVQGHAEGMRAVVGGYLDMALILRDFFRFLLERDKVTGNKEALGPKSYSLRNLEEEKR